MSNRNRLIAIGLFALFAGNALRAEPVSGPLHQRLPLEIAAEKERILREAAEMDRDGDGYISAEERRAWREAKRAQREQQGLKVRVEDYVERRMARLEAMDANQDGRIDVEEWRAFHSGKAHGRWHAEGKSRGKSKVRD